MDNRNYFKYQFFLIFYNKYENKNKTNKYV